jgi:hypothetical protein
MSDKLTIGQPVQIVAGLLRGAHGLIAELREQTVVVALGQAGVFVKMTLVLIGPIETTR